MKSEFAKLRVKLGYSQAEMARALGLSLPTLHAYEYGRVQHIPEQVVQAARQLEPIEPRREVAVMYEGMTMRQVAQAWAARLLVDENSPQAIANAIGVNKSTVSRWLHRDRQIKPAQLALYEWRVRLAAGDDPGEGREIPTAGSHHPMTSSRHDAITSWHHAVTTSRHHNVMPLGIDSVNGRRCAQ